MRLHPEPRRRTAKRRAAQSQATAHEFALVDITSEPATVSGELPVAPLPAAHSGWPPPAPADLRHSQSVVIPLQRGDDARERILKRDTGALRVAFNILEKWGVGGEKSATLLGVPRRTLYQWARNVDGDGLREPLPPSILERVSYLLGIWKAALILLPTESAAVRFMQTPNRADTFGGRTPLQRMQDGRVTDLAAVRQWLDGWRGG
jgi:hypothetical protein